MNVGSEAIVVVDSLNRIGAETISDASDYVPFTVLGYAVPGVQVSAEGNLPPVFGNTYVDSLSREVTEDVIPRGTRLRPVWNARSDCEITRGDTKDKR
jgi:hypothetical protein